LLRRIRLACRLEVGLRASHGGRTNLKISAMYATVGKKGRWDLGRESQERDAFPADAGQDVSRRESHLERGLTHACAARFSGKSSAPRRRWAWGTLLVAALFAAMPAAAQSILPSSFGGWTQKSTASFTPPAGAAGAAAAEYGFTSGTQSSYARGSDQLTVTLYRMKDPSGAYGEYSYLRTPDMHYANLGAYSAISDSHALVLDGNLLLDVAGRDLTKADSSLKALVAAISPHAEQGALPTLMNDLPAKGLVPRTDHYILGPVVLNQLFPVAMGSSLGFSDGAEAEVAKYRAGGQDTTLLLVDYPTPQFASTKLKQLEQQFDINDSQNNNASTPLYAKRELTSLIFVAGAKSQTEASALLGHVQSGEVLTWNEPTFQFTQPGIGAVVVGTIVGSGIICLFALISGLAFGGVRLVVKRALPDRVFDRSDQLEILQLGLASKPIKSEDFYG
jgi:hypothetical protein